MTRKPRVVVAVAGALALGISVFWIGELLPQHMAASAGLTQAPNPPGLVYRLFTANGKQRFHIGEPIPIRMCFSSTAPDAYRLEYAQYDRSGRMHQDRFLVTPRTGYADPLAEYFRTGLLVGMMGGLRTSPVLSTEPLCVSAFLNEWLRFDSPGKYTVTARSARIEQQVEGAEEPRTETVEVESSPLVIEIAPRSADWEAAEFERIRSHQSGLAESVNISSTMRLRFLGTPAALRVLARRLSENGDDAWDCVLGLAGSPFRREALRAMEGVFVHPDREVPPFFVAVLSYLRMRDYYVIWFPELRRDQSISEWQRLFYERLGELYRAADERQKMTIAHELATLIPRKSPRARQQCLRTLDRFDPELAEAANGGPLPAEERPLNSLPFEAARAPEPPHPSDPQFREQVLADLGQASPQFPLKTLLLLPDESLPGYERHFAERAKDNPWLFGHLLVRYGTGQGLQAMRREWDRSHSYWSCDSRTPFLAYFLKFDSKDGRRLFREAMEDRKDNGCYLWYPEKIVKLLPGADIEDEVIHVLRESDAEAAAVAARWLGAHGGAKAESALWETLEKWHQKWDGRTRELIGNVITNPLYMNYERRLGLILSDAIFTAHGWRLGDVARERLLRLCLESRCRENLEQHADKRFPVMITIGGAGAQPRFRVAQYEPGTTERLAEKLAQYPKGTVFGWCGDRDNKEQDQPEDREDRARLLDIARTLLGKNRHRLDADPPSGTCFVDSPPRSR